MDKKDNNSVINNPEKLKKVLYTLADERTGNGWKNDYSPNEIERITEIYRVLEDEGINNFRFNPVYVCKEVLNEWEKYKEIPETIELVELVIKKAKRI